MVRSADLRWQAWNLQEELSQRPVLRMARADSLRRELGSLDALALRLARSQKQLQLQAAEASEERRRRRAGRRWRRLVGHKLQRALQVTRSRHLEASL